MSQASAKIEGFHPSAPRNSGNRSFGTSAGLASGSADVPVGLSDEDADEDVGVPGDFGLLLIRAES